MKYICLALYKLQSTGIFCYVTLKQKHRVFLYSYNTHIINSIQEKSYENPSELYIYENITNQSFYDNVNECNIFINDITLSHN